MRLTYLYNSGFLLETAHANIIFDYYRKGHDIIRRVLDSPLPLYVFVSHSHADHFNADILGWHRKHRDTHYIFADELRSSTPSNERYITYLKEGECHSDDCLRVEAFGSTDLGGSFYVTIEGATIFHAGDFNNWHWRDESTEAEAAVAEYAFLTILEKISAAHKRVDITFFPVDGRMGNNYAKGAKQYIEAVETKIFVPMHFWNHPDMAKSFAPEVESKGIQYIMLEHTGSAVELVL